MTMCPHARPSASMCPHCLGVGSFAPSPTTGSRSNPIEKLRAALEKMTPGKWHVSGDVARSVGDWWVVTSRCPTAGLENDGDDEGNIDGIVELRNTVPMLLELLDMLEWELKCATDGLEDGGEAYLHIDAFKQANGWDDET